MKIEYQKYILKSYLLPYIAEGKIFQYNGSLCYTLHITKKFLTDKDIAGVTRFSCPKT